jgi:hypothetical protein
MTSNNLINADIGKKTQLTNQLVATMNSLYNKIDKSRVTSTNLPNFVSKYNELVLRKMGEIQGAPPMMQDRIPDRMLFERVDSRKDMTPQERLQQLQALRDRDIPDMRRRPPTPDFSLDGSGKKKKQESQNFDPPRQQRQARQMSEPREMVEDFGALNAFDEDTNALDVYDVGISVDDVEEDNTPLDVKLRMLQQQRDSSFQPQPQQQQEMSTPIRRPRQQQEMSTPIRRPQQQQQQRPQQQQRSPPQPQRPPPPPQQEQQQDLVPLSEVELILGEQKAYYENEINKVQSEMKQMRVQNNMLNNELSKLHEEGIQEDSGQSQKLDAKKEEIKKELDKLRAKHLDMENTLNANEQLELKINKKMTQLKSIMDKCDTEDYVEVIDSREAAYQSPYYEYIMDTIYDDIVAVHVASHYIQSFPHNITPLKNMLYINDTSYTIPPGDYTMTTLVQTINDITNEEFMYDETLKKVTSKNNIVFQEGENNIRQILQTCYLPRERTIKVFVNDVHMATITGDKIYNYNNVQNLDDRFTISFKTGSNQMIDYPIAHRMELIIKTRKELII